jgi:vitamin B12 transporter
MNESHLKYMRPFLKPAVLLLLCASAFSQSNQDTDSLQHLSSKPSAARVTAAPDVITVTATPLLPEIVPMDVSVTTISVSEKLAIHDPSDLFGLVRGLHVSQAIPFAPSTLYQLGADPNFCLVLLDGVPMNDPNDMFGGAVDLSALDLSNVSRLEIVSGPLSAVYGSQAISGVVNVISRQHAPEEPTTADIELAGGSFGLARGMARSLGGLLGWDYSISYDHQRIGEQVKKDEQEFDGASMRFDRGTSSSTTFNGVLHVLYHGSSGFPLTSGGPEFAIVRDPESRNRTTVTSAVEIAHENSNNFKSRFGLSVLHAGDRFETPAILDSLPPGPRSVPSTIGTSSYWRVEAQARADWRVRPSLMAVLRLNPVFEFGARNSAIGGWLPDAYRLKRPGMFGASELIWQRDKWMVLGAIGLTATSEYHIASPRVAASVELSHKVWLRGGFGLGFKLPSFLALGDELIGNRKLLPERSESADAGVEWRGPRGLRISASYVHARYTDLIDFSPTLFRLVNRRAAVVDSAIMEASQAINSALELNANVSYSSASLEGTTEPLRNRPRWRGSTHLLWNAHRRLSFAAEGQFVGRRFDFALPRPDISSVGGYSLVSATASYHAPDRLELFLRVHNLLDQQFHEVIGFRNPGTMFEGGLRWQVLRRTKIRPSREED